MRMQPVDSIEVEPPVPSRRPAPPCPYPLLEQLSRSCEIFLLQDSWGLHPLPWAGGRDIPRGTGSLTGFSYCSRSTHSRADPRQYIQWNRITLPTMATIVIATCCKYVAQKLIYNTKLPSVLLHFDQLSAIFDLIGSGISKLPSRRGLIAHQPAKF